MAAPFSRLQLAAALLEYDNDPDNPDAPKRRAQDSAIFAHMRRAQQRRPLDPVDAGSSTDYLGLTVPTDASGAGDTRRSRTSQSVVLNNPFGADDEAEGVEELGEVDLASWGLDTFIPKEKGSKNVKGKAKSDGPQHTRQFSSAPVGQRADGRPPHNRAMSLGDFGAGGAFLDADSMGAVRRNSISNPLDGMEEYEVPHDRQRFSSHAAIEGLPVMTPLHTTHDLEEQKGTIPFPTSPEEHARSQSRLSRLDGPSHARTHSNATVGTLASRQLMANDGSKPFAIPPPPPDRASRFDPKYAASMLREDGYNRESVFDAGSMRDRRLSAASFGTRQMLDNDFHSTFSRDEYPDGERPYSRFDLMRPKVLIMPSPLQNQDTPTSPSKTRDGYVDSSDGRPLPPGARSRPVSMLDLNAAAASGSTFTPNPRLSLSASQLLFRNTLMVDGQRDPSFADIDGLIDRAREDGEQVRIGDDAATESVAAPSVPVPPVENKDRRAPGKLFGRSLIDDLEARKAEMRSKQRVFTGDHRPKMMERQGSRQSTLIDPESLQAKPPLSRMNSGNVDSSLNRRGSRSGKPLLTFDEVGRINETEAEARMPKTRSVFGVDTIWEREMAKLKEIEAQEKAEAEERRRLEEELEAKMTKKKKRMSGHKDKHHEEEGRSPISQESSEKLDAERRQSTASFLTALPDIPQVTSRRRTAPIADDSDDDESDASDIAPPRISMSSAIRDKAADDWVSDDENKKAQPLSPVSPNSTRPQTTASRLFMPQDDDSDEDVPLSVTLQRASQKLSARALEDDSSDEDKPIAALIDKTRSSRFSISFDNPTSPKSIKGATPPAPLKAADSEESDEDNQPLGLRASRFPTSSVFGGLSIGGLGSQAGGDEDEDDKPLALHPEQMRKSQYQMFVQAQQQQQFFQAQMAANAMAFAQPPMMMMYPQPPPSVTGDAAKFGRVDRWRHDVAIEGET